MHCPFCRHTDSRVVDSRATDDGTAIRRRRQCPECGRRFTTVETASLTVVKRSGATEPFSRDKVLVGVRKACQGRPVTEDDLALLAQRVEETIRAAGAAPRSRRTRSAWPSSSRCASSTRSPTCGSPPSTRPSTPSRTSRPRSPCCAPSATPPAGAAGRAAATAPACRRPADGTAADAQGTTTAAPSVSDRVSDPAYDTGTTAREEPRKGPA